ncbi:MAG TPA: hypothetical protein VLJ61_07850 [Pyrinomonadaceae bacterium]|nr:hypothetical protein [Pyrinomonadaceae bacterium]
MREIVNAVWILLLPLASFAQTVATFSSKARSLKSRSLDSSIFDS